MTNNGSLSKLKIIPLGGLHEIGKNTCIYEYEDEILIVDAGLAFPTDEMHGVNIVLPELTYLRENRHKIKGMIATHGHEDHIGGIPYHLKQVDIPVIYGPRLAIALLQDKLEEAAVLNRTTLKTVGPREMVRVGKNFVVEFIRNTHSMADSFTLAIHTPMGILIHTGDFKVDHTPVDGERFDFHRLAEYGEKGVLCLLSDSTNSEVPGQTPSESSVIPNLDRIFAEAQGRIMLTTFASSVHRVNITLQLAQKYNRKVAVAGRSMLNVIAHCRNLGYIKCPDDLFVPIKSTKGLPDERVVILTTGSQGEPLAAMTRISKGEHPLIKVRPGDTIIFSANPIPGNTIAVVNCIDRLMMQGANVIYGRDKGIHVSGHGCQEDQKMMLALTKPKFFVPVHGEHRMLVKHSQTAQKMGVSPDNIVIIKNGDVIELTPERIEVVAQVPAGLELVDQVGIVHEHIMEERQQLADDGVVTVAATVNSEGKLITQPEVNLRGVVTVVERSLLHQLINRSVEQLLSERSNEFKTEAGATDWAKLRQEIENYLQRLIKRELRSQPLVIFLLQWTEQGEPIPQTEHPQPAEQPEVSESTTPRRTYRRRRSTASMAS
ncbi:beta-lactamase domain protein [Gloeothece citriformis PCC 7424]|uniref:Ribonuclease J n=1 Tax=Gloeothece citriformis (strain PCC 7424) TaxID=65393 RepID=B7KG18_GLOC7|nr:ribonuclease J [Gloeothece citriformis]ACK69211.1 beta-lactamase domain protein [Gloeothece citriformis PCC 7424]